MRKLKIMMGGILFLFCVFSIVRNDGEAAVQYPVKPITFIVPLEAGADGDVMARPVLQKVSEILGKPIMVVNKPGAGSSLGYRDVYDAKPDGYTFGVAYTSIVTNKLQGISPFDYHDLTVMGTFYNWSPIIVGSTKSKRPFKTIQEVISFAKSHPGEVSMSTSGVGMSLWWGTMYLLQGTGLQLNVVPQPGAGSFIIAQVAGGHTDLGTINLAVAQPQIEAGNARILAHYGSKQILGYEKVPSLKDLGYDVEWEGPSFWIGPPKMPKDIVNKLTDAFEKATNSPEYQKYCMERNATALYLSPDKAVGFLDKIRKVCIPIGEKGGILKAK